jgi:hypothetical protein
VASVLMVAAGLVFQGLAAPRPATREEIGIAQTIDVPGVTVRTDRGTPIDVKRLTEAVAPGTVPDGYAGRLIVAGGADALSNCHGWVFTDGEFCVDGARVDDILRENGYGIHFREPFRGLARYLELVTVRHCKFRLSKVSRCQECGGDLTNRSVTVMQSARDAFATESVAPTPRSITVLIPTYKRPGLLRCALESVRNQSRLDLVSEIVVSENSDDPQSEVVCQDFPDLPIRFVRQTPALDVGSHFALLPTLAETPLVALLGDDDMWGRYHLEESARLLAIEPEAVAYVGMAVIVSSSARQVKWPFLSILQSEVSPWSDRFLSHWTWSAKDVLLASLFWTPLNMWATVGRRNTLIEAMKVFQDPNQGTDSDRFMIWRVAKLGKIVVAREIGLFFRVHSDSGCARQVAEAPDFHRRSWRRNLERMLDEAAEIGIDAKAEWDKTFGDTELPGILYDQSGMVKECRDTLLRRWGPIRHLRGPDKTPLSYLKMIARESLPPFLRRGLVKIRGLVK